MRKFEVSLNFEMLKSLERTKYLFDTQTGRIALGKNLLALLVHFAITRIILNKRRLDLFTEFETNYTRSYLVFKYIPI